MGAREIKKAYKTKVAFSLSEFSESKIIEWRFNVCNSKKELHYDMIIGRDLLKQLGMVLDFQKETNKWDLKTTIPMQGYAKLRKFSGKEIKKMIQSTKEPIMTQKATNRIIIILDSNYHKANLCQVMAKATHLSDSEHSKLYNLLLQYKDLFDGTLGKWKTEPVELELKDDAKPYNQRYYLMPHICKNTFKKELDRLEELGVLEKVQESEWGLPNNP